MTIGGAIVVGVIVGLVVGGLLISFFWRQIREEERPVSIARAR